MLGAISPSISSTFTTVTIVATRDSTVSVSLSTTAYSTPAPTFVPTLADPAVVAPSLPTPITTVAAAESAGTTVLSVATIGTTTRLDQQNFIQLRWGLWGTCT